MKQKLLALLLLVLPLAPLALLMPGCATTERNERLSVVAEIAARRGTSMTLAAHPEYRLAFEAAVTAFDQLLLQPEVDYAAFTEAVQSLKIDEIQGEEGALLIADVISLYRVGLDNLLTYGDDSRFRPVAEGIRDGVKSGVALSEPQ